MNYDKDSSTDTTRQQKVALPSEFVGCIETPYGAHYINRGEAADHASMRSAQLTGLLMMMRDEGAERFRMLSPRLQESLTWMITELSSEVEAMFEIVTGDVLGSKQ